MTVLTSPTATAALQVRDLQVAYQGRVVIDNLSVQIPAGQISIILGANACGKSALLRTMARLITPVRGEVLLAGHSVHHQPTRQVATQLALLPQHPIAPEGITVIDLVGRGRYPHQGRFSRWSRADDLAVAEAMTAAGITDLATRQLDELSGGQRQRVWIAMALAQQTEILLLDEPTTFLDIAHQIEVLDLLVDLNQSRGSTIVVVLHDLNLAARYADTIYAMRDGRLVAQGHPDEVVTPEMIHEVFGVHSVVCADPLSGRPMVVPRSRHRS